MEMSNDMGKQLNKTSIKWHKLIKVFLIITAVAMLICLIANAVVVLSGQAYILNLRYSDDDIISGLPKQKTDCILILGAGLQNGYPSLMLQERLDLGAALYRAGASDKILVSGDNSRDDYNEVQAMEDYLVDVHGIPRKNIVMDHAGFSTYESMYRAKEIFCVNSVIVVTQKYHLLRAAYDASCMGLEVYAADAHKIDYPQRYNREARECLARIKDFFMCIFKPAPTYMGEKLSIKP